MSTWLRVQGAKRRWAAVAARMQRRPGGSNGSASAGASPSATVSTAQLTRIRAALAELAALTVSSSQGLSRMQAGVDDYDIDAGG